MDYKRTTIRNIDPAILEEAREIVRTHSHETMGGFITDALAFYIASLPEAEDEASPEYYQDGRF